MTAPLNDRSTTTQRPFRTLGLSLAIIAVFFLLGFVPVIPAVFVGVLAVEQHPTVANDPTFWLEPVFGLIVIVCCVLAWIGRPRRAGLYFQVATILSSLVTVYTALHSSAVISFNSGIGGGNLDNFFRTAGNCLLPVRLIVLAYTLWYVNRAPARAFYHRRG